MNECRDLAKKSVNDIYKIAAKIIVNGDGNSEIGYARPNIRLDALTKVTDESGRIGGASNTIHAETAVLIGAPHTQNGILYVTDPLCPNCMKNAIEAGIEKIFIDTQGFDKPWYQNRHHYFDHISVPLASAAGISLMSVNCPAEDIPPLNSPSCLQEVTESLPVQIKPSLSDSTNIFEAQIEKSEKIFKDLPHAISTGFRPDGQEVILIAAQSYPRGIDDSQKKTLETISRYNRQKKYKIKIDPVTRLMMSASRYGISLRGSHMYCSHLPSARCQINAVGYGLSDIKIGKIRYDAKTNDLEAAISLHRHGILKFTIDQLNQSTTRIFDQ